MTTFPNYSLVLLAESDERVLATMLKALRSAGYHAVGVSTFEEGRRQIALDPPRVLIAGTRLGSHSGMHLAFLARRHRSECEAVIIGHDRECALEHEIVQEGFAFVVGPLPTTVLPTLVTALGAEAPLPAGPGFWLDPRFNRRRGERRQTLTPGYSPDRRASDRRRPDSGIVTCPLRSLK